MVENVNLQLSTNWELNEKYNLPDCVQKTFEITEELVDIDVDELTNLESCVCIQKGVSDEPAELTISVANPNAVIKRIDIVCEAKFIELFQKDSQYLSCYAADVIDDFEGMAVNYCKIILTTEYSGVTLRFSRLKEPDRIWIYGIRVQLTPIQLAQSQSSISSQMSAALAQKLENLSMGSQDCPNCHHLKTEIFSRIDAMEQRIIQHMSLQQHFLLQEIKKISQPNPNTQ